MTCQHAAQRVYTVSELGKLGKCAKKNAAVAPHMGIYVQTGCIAMLTKDVSCTLVILTLFAEYFQIRLLVL